MKNFVVCIVVCCLSIVIALQQQTHQALPTEPPQDAPYQVKWAENWASLSLQEYGMIRSDLLSPTALELIAPYVDEHTCPFTAEYNGVDEWGDWAAPLKLCFKGKKKTRHIVFFDLKEDKLNLRPVRWVVMDRWGNVLVTCNLAF